MAQSTEIWEKFWAFESSRGLLSRLLYQFRDRVWVIHFVRIALRHTQKGRVLEAGSGSALSSIKLAKLRGDEATAVDLSSTALELAREAAQRYGVPLVTLRHDMTGMPFPDQSFDLVWNSGTMEHFDDPVPVMRELLRCGRIVITIIPARGIGFDLLLLFQKILPASVSVAFLEGNEHWYTVDQWRQVIEAAGGKDVISRKITLCGIFDYIYGVGRSA